MSPLGRGELRRRQAEREILAILDRVPDSQLPEPRIEKRADEELAWYGGRGWHIKPTTARDNTESRRFDLMDAFEQEWLRRERRRRYGRGYEFRDGKQIGGQP